MSIKQRTINLLAIVGVPAILVGSWYFFLGDHGFWVPGEESFGELWHSKEHWYLELAIGTLQILVIDVFFGLIVWRLVIRPHIHRDIEHADHDHEPDHYDESDHYDEGEVNRSIPTVQEVFRVIDLEDAITVALYHLEKEDPEVAAKVLSVAFDKKGE